MEVNKLFSIIIPTYNYGNYLPRALDSILLDPQDDYEIIVVDDGSTDDTATIINSYLQNHPGKVRYFYQVNQGVATARNTGIVNAVGAYLSFLDADDEILPTALDFWRQKIKEFPNTDFLLAGYITQFPDGKTKQKAPGTLVQNVLKNFQAYMQQKLFIANAAGIIKRKVFDTLRFGHQLPAMFDEAFYTSLLLSYHCMSFSEPVLRVHRHYDSLRHSHAHIMATDELVNKFLITPEHFSSSLRSKILRQFRARCLLTLFRSCYLNGDPKKARYYYHEVIRTYPPNIFWWSYLRKYIRICLGIAPVAQ